MVRKAATRSARASTPSTPGRRSRRARISFDIDPVRRIQAAAQGFTVARDRESALGEAGLILCATGARALRGDDFPLLRNGAYVATVTNSEDELDLAGLPDTYTETAAGAHVARHETTGHYFYLLNGGNAVNFLHGASVGPFIFLVQAEILAGPAMLTAADSMPVCMRSPQRTAMRSRGSG
ncbi:hypothetical protein [Yinghuangia soli]|uniref:hypothetical protein n=1 Tax=Yinghuangia soli TaxID=2908204 RepID=UPI0027E2B98A|nr:hypothetical protein [Yinghuangia soli]